MRPTPSSRPRRPGRSGRPGSTETVLVRGVNWLGDAVMTTPALLRLREFLPQARITMLTPARLGELWLHHPAIDDVLPIEPHENPWQLGRRLRARRFDLGVAFPNAPRAGLELWLGRVRRRVGFAGRWRRWLLTDVVLPPPGSHPMRKRSAAEVARLLAGSGGGAPGPPIPAGAHQVHHYLRLVAHLGASPEPLAPRLVLSDAERAGAPGWLRHLEGTGARPGPARWAGLNAGAEYGPAKRWPADRFAAVANAVSHQTGVRWLVLGGPGDRALAGDLARQIPGALALAGRTNLRELMQALSVCEAVLTNDTGPMHVAAALGAPVVALFGSTSPELTAPGFPGDPPPGLLRRPVPCAPCFLRRCPADFRCLLGLTVEQVTAAVLEALRRPGDRPA